MFIFVILKFYVSYFFPKLKNIGGGTFLQTFCDWYLRFRGAPRIYRKLQLAAVLAPEAGSSGGA